MPTQFDTDFGRLKEKLLKMGAIAEQMINDIVSVVVDREEDLLDKVGENEQQMDSLQNEIDEETIRLMAVHTPVAGDLRLLLVIARINAELERIGDQAMNIGFYVKALLKEEPMKPLVDIPRLAEMAKDMLGKALDAFTRRSSNLALEVIKVDDKVDQLHDQIFRELMTYVIGDPKTISRVLELILIARAFERMADHAVSIAEDVVYMVEGRNVRHADI
jgi:phosphate transport system protein